MTWLKVLGIGLVSLFLFGAGYKFAAALYQADIAELERAHALALADKEKEYRANERKQIDAVTQAWDEYEKAKAEIAESRGNADNLRSELDRLRRLADGHKSGLPATSANPCKHCSDRLARCVGLLEEGAGLSVEGAELSQEGADLSSRIAAKKDAVVKIHNGN